MTSLLSERLRNGNSGHAASQILQGAVRSSSLPLSISSTLGNIAASAFDAASMSALGIASRQTHQPSSCHADRSSAGIAVRCHTARGYLGRIRRAWEPGPAANQAYTGTTRPAGCLTSDGQTTRRPPISGSIPCAPGPGSPLAGCSRSSR